MTTRTPIRQQRVELCRVQESDLLVGFVRGGLLDLSTRVRVGPPLAAGKLEDATQVRVAIANCLGRQPGVEAFVEECLDVVRVKLPDRRLAEMRLEVDADLGFVIWPYQLPCFWRMRPVPRGRRLLRVCTQIRPPVRRPVVVCESPDRRVVIA